MPMQVVNGAVLTCSFGAAPSNLAVLPLNRVQTGYQLAANIQDHVPMTIHHAVWMCACPSNPQVAAATTAALGVLTPQPCIPVTPAPWAPGSATVELGNQPALDDVSTLSCTWGGVISITSPGETSDQIP